MSDEVKACMKCAGCDLTIPPESLKDIRAIQSGVYYCKKCGWMGVPVVFEDEEQYKKFLESRS